MILRDGNVRLRPIVLPDDLRLAVPWYQDPEVLYYSEGGASATLYDTGKVEKMYRYLLNKGEVFIIEVLAGNQWVAIGDAALCPDCLPIVIGEGKYRSQGVGKKVLGLLIQHARSQGLRKLLVNGVYVFNKRSRRMYERHGFRATKTFVDDDGNESIAFELILSSAKNTQYYLDKFVEVCKEELRENLTGVYLHGSLAMGCFHPKRSDMDLLVVVKEKLTGANHRRITNLALTLHDEMPNERGIEFSIIRETYLKPFVHPTPFEFHYSEIHRDRYRADENYLCGGLEDPDLASQIVIAYHRGIPLYGKPLHEMYDPVDKQFYLASILYDIEGASQDIAHNPVYITLNLCRVMYFLTEGVISSKKEGGEWGVKKLPHRYQELVQTCLDYYIGKTDEIELDQQSLLSFADYMLRGIKQSISFN